MTRISLLLLLIGAVTFQGIAQDEGDRAFKKAKRALGAFNIDPGANADKLGEAREMMDIAMADPTVQADPESWITSGQIALEEAQRDLSNAILNPNSKPIKPRAALDGFNAFREALSRSEKRYHRRDALKGITDVIGHLNNMAIMGYQTDNYDVAHQGFAAVIEAHELLLGEKEKSPLDDKAYQDALFSASATCQGQAGQNKCISYLEKLRTGNYPNAYIYDLLYQAYVETDKGKAVSYLEEGRKKYPDEVSLLFTEINHYLREGRMDELVGRLQTAIEREPENKSLYLTLGNVYDNLFQKAMEAHEESKAEEHFLKALSYYQQALEKDENYLDATYSIGALYYNRAAVYQQGLNALADDYSKEGLKKFDALKEKMNVEFDKALPYFQKAEKLDPNDTNTLIALKEIFARKNDLALSNEFKTRLETVQKGGKNPVSYFK
jgi:tetratricopeptide (TPR) repeat protein